MTLFVCLDRDLVNALVCLRFRGVCHVERIRRNVDPTSNALRFYSSVSVRRTRRRVRSNLVVLLTVVLRVM